MTLKGDYKRKIKTLDQLTEAIGPFPREKKVIMCHGTFDIVHPGHIRHMLYAKNKADLLIISLTSDEHINKANYRPYIPQDLRAMNLAMLEVVDFVVIDRNERPVKNLGVIQPDYFAKGADYQTENLNPLTKEEVDVVEGYGGTMIFTPGDVVFSSSHIINSNPPSMKMEKLKVLMDSEGVTFTQLHDTLDKFNTASVHVLGDTIVDRYTYTSVIGSSSKTPTMSVKLNEVLDYTGGAAIVAKHIKATGARVCFTSVLGNDEARDHVIKDLEEAGVEMRIVIDPSRPTTLKNAIIASGYRLLKVDSVDNRAISKKIQEELKTSIKNSKDFNAIVFSDFRHGIFSKQTIPKLVEAIPENIIKVADSQVASRWGNILEFVGFDLITPNEKEARFSLGDQDSVVRPLALKLYKEAKCKMLILKLGERGILTYRPHDERDPKAFFNIDAFVDNAVDAVGTGDALLSYATLSLAVGESEVVASILGSVAAALACENDGNIPIVVEKVHDRLSAIETRMNFQ